MRGSPRETVVRRLRRGFTLIEMLIVVAMIGIMVGVVAPKFRLNEATETQLAAMQVAQDLDLARTRALGTRSAVRYVFRTAQDQYVGFLDDDRDGGISETDGERLALRGFGLRSLPARTEFGRGSADPIPDDTDPGDSDGVTFDGGRIEYSPRGIVEPMGTAGVIYIKHKRDPEAVSAVRVSPSGSVRIWKWREGEWQ
jgi:prepilin-type N-terminal cleavage/methylation domain-containing protein